MRILIGLTEIAGLIPVFADGFRKLGHQVTTVIRSHHRLNPEIEYDVDLGQPVVGWPSKIAQSTSWNVKIPREIINRGTNRLRLVRLIANHDIFVFQWARASLLPAHNDYLLLKRLGKQIVSLFMGSDVRYYPAYKQWYGMASRYLNEVPFREVPFTDILHNIRMAEMYSDLILSLPNQSILALRPYDHFFVPVDLSAYPFHLPGRDTPVVVHAPSSKGIKGSNYILQALDQLKADGVSFELRFMDGVPHLQLKNELANADVLIDELFFPLHGKLAVEAMASGCAVATGDRQDYEPYPPDRPIWYINPENMYQQLKILLTDKELRVRLAMQGREYVETYYDHLKVCRRILDRIDLAPMQKRDHYPEFFARDFRLGESEVVPDDLKRITTQIIQKWGLPEDVHPQELIQKGLASKDLLKFLNTIPQWHNW